MSFLAFSCPAHLGQWEVDLVKLSLAPRVCVQWALTFSASWSESGLSAPFQFRELNQENLISQWGPFPEFLTEPLHAQRGPLPAPLGPLNSQDRRGLQPAASFRRRAWILLGCPQASRGTQTRPPPLLCGDLQVRWAPRRGAALAPGSEPFRLGLLPTSSQNPACVWSGSPTAARPVLE